MQWMRIIVIQRALRFVLIEQMRRLQSRSDVRKSGSVDPSVHPKVLAFPLFENHRSRASFLVTFHFSFLSPSIVGKKSGKNKQPFLLLISRRYDLLHSKYSNEVSSTVSQTNGDAHSEFLSDLMTAKWGKFFHNIKIVSDFAGIKRFVTGYRR